MGFYSREKYVYSISYLKIFRYFIPTFVTVMGANMQGTTKPLIGAHRVSLCAFFLTKIFQYIALVADYKSQCNQANYSQSWGLISIIFGSLFTISSVLTFIPHSISDIILYIAWLYASIIIVVCQYRRSFMDACCWLYRN